MAFDWKSLFSAGISDVVEKVGAAIDRNVTNEGERIALKNQLEQIRMEARDRSEERTKDLDIAADEQATARLQADMASDNAWSKNIRPMSFAFSLGMFTLMAFIDSYSETFKVGDKYIEVFMYILLIEIGFYFSSRGLEKIADIISRIWTKGK